MSATTGYARNNIERFEENVQNQRPYNKSREKDRLHQIAGYGSGHADAHHQKSISVHYGLEVIVAFNATSGQHT